MTAKFHFLQIPASHELTLRADVYSGHHTHCPNMGQAYFVFTTSKYVKRRGMDPQQSNVLTPPIERKISMQ